MNELDLFYSCWALGFVRRLAPLDGGFGFENLGRCRFFLGCNSSCRNSSVNSLPSDISSYKREMFHCVLYYVVKHALKFRENLISRIKYNQTGRTSEKAMWKSVFLFIKYCVLNANSPKTSFLQCHFLAFLSAKSILLGYSKLFV